MQGVSFHDFSTKNRHILSIPLNIFVVFEKKQKQMRTDQIETRH